MSYLENVVFSDSYCEDTNKTWNNAFY